MISHHHIGRGPRWPRAQPHPTCRAERLRVVHLGEGQFGEFNSFEMCQRDVRVRRQETGKPKECRYGRSAEREGSVALPLGHSTLRQAALLGALAARFSVFAGIHADVPLV